MKLQKIIAIVVLLALIVGLVIGIVLYFVHSSSEENEVGEFTFPGDFKFGAASASYQIEGAWDEDGKTASIWDTITHNDPLYIKDRSNGDVAANSYHFYQKDIDALTKIGVSTN